MYDHRYTVKIRCEIIKIGYKVILSSFDYRYNRHLPR